ncbi:MAG TPA: YggS family pyridoxal phosphate-dependent enzyme [Burkholderiaceae bacterium]|nr:YggS family pyridoxal phosphate-dependent enzyme [Burkholderiaceae bacterium]
MTEHTEPTDTFSQRLANVRQRIAQAAHDADRDPAEITLLPVSKTFDETAIREAMACGLTRFGENKVQELAAKQQGMQDAGIDWVMIGHLQSNKARDVARYASEIQSLDRLSLARRLENRLQTEGRGIDALVQVKTSTEPTKYGLDPAELPDFVREVARSMPSLRIKGLMTLAINVRNEEAVRACFRHLRELRDRLREEAIDGVEMERLSMGMSGDMELAIAEGATELRIGTALFGQRPYPDSYYWPEQE